MKEKLSFGGEDLMETIQEIEFLRQQFVKLGYQNN